VKTEAVAGDVATGTAAAIALPAEHGDGLGITAAVAGTGASHMSARSDAGVLHASGAASSAQDDGSGGELTLKSYEAMTPRRLEVGLSGGSYGWLHVRAEMGADGGVQAMLRGPAEAANALRAQATQMTSYLAGQASPLSHLSIETGKPSAGVPTQAGFGGAGQGSRGEQQDQPSPRNSGTTGNGLGRRVAALEEKPSEAIVSGDLAAAVRSGPSIASTGGWLSVRV
jgi:hypothetical protein